MFLGLIATKLAWLTLGWELQGELPGAADPRPPALPLAAPFPQTLLWGAAAPQTARFILGGSAAPDLVREEFRFQI